MKKFKNAFEGLLDLLKDKSILIQVSLAILCLGLAIGLQISSIDFCIILICIGLVLGFEMINTCIERLCDLYTSSYNKEVKMIKDMAAGFVLFISMIAAVVGIFVFIKYIWR